jgi:hypothetical protein
MVNPSFIPRDDANQEVLSFTVINLQVNGENVLFEPLRLYVVSFFFAPVIQATRIIVVLPPYYFSSELET